MIYKTALLWILTSNYTYRENILVSVEEDCGVIIIKSKARGVAWGAQAIPRKDSWIQTELV